ncbi:hypothetical protein Sf19_gp75 [Shigella phage Sf19]|uniref:Uncharacterized protein n=3 Tax=Mooglevirus TaxID=1985303 RepID=A0A291AY13_9CAUD|nr:hypothetical protein FDI44_gp044 [Shigella phage Sf13]ATE85905.1 hypothetical protein Sf13_gp105 [Shigella phage Sf13]AUV56292.1 hypothetical protein Sf19_gp75 [Shigella phage Sf19]ELT8207068.1 hypothetical protein [Escherichia coli]QBP33124.1 hypothetical protein Silverhawkium_gp37 [Shigella phage Silverhawkium]
MTLSEIEVQLQCAGYSQKEIEGMFIALCSGSRNLKVNPEVLRKVDIFIAGGKIAKDKTGYLKGEHVDIESLL